MGRRLFDLSDPRVRDAFAPVFQAAARRCRRVTEIELVNDDPPTLLIKTRPIWPVTRRRTRLTVIEGGAFLLAAGIEASLIALFMDWALR